MNVNVNGKRFYGLMTFVAGAAMLGTPNSVQAQGGDVAPRIGAFATTPNLGLRPVGFDFDGQTWIVAGAMAEFRVTFDRDVNVPPGAVSVATVAFGLRGNFTTSYDGGTRTRGGFFACKDGEGEGGRWHEVARVARGGTGPWFGVARVSRPVS
jgi:hypothetical protein